MGTRTHDQDGFFSPPLELSVIQGGSKQARKDDGGLWVTRKGRESEREGKGMVGNCSYVPIV